MGGASYIVGFHICFRDTMEAKGQVRVNSTAKYKDDERQRDDVG